ncbi:MULTISPECIES: PPOX class F420-dependent oxidoreductase [Actinoplanes]|uniref:PPOX class F420-dependent oxidoreductase n=1 Tax=Actinoplanes TaxID=1865 RepID=UPI0005F2A367|nr:MULTISPECIES: PPOX class F420-dependent oxidoreductase [Actinoplanes]GLY04015.1 PPOX class F420-dependent oxidoreductase [Actinoplanes sp. NBRC 101535]
MSAGAQFAATKQISLTTYRKDGTPVATPVWHVVEGDTMTIISEADAWKVKRIRNNPRVRVTVCDIRGKVADGATPVDGTARVLDERESLAARDRIARRYLMSRVGNWFAKAFRVKRKPIVGIVITF